MIRVDCRACGSTLDVSRRERAKEVPCPRCAEPVTIPASLDFRGARIAASGERKTGDRALAVACVSAILCALPPVSAAVWWWSANRIARAEDEGRVPVESLLIARVISAVAFTSQLGWLALLAASL